MGLPLASGSVQPVRDIGDGIHKRDVAGRIGRDHGVADAVERDAQVLALRAFGIERVFVVAREHDEASPRQEGEQRAEQRENQEGPPAPGKRVDSPGHDYEATTRTRRVLASLSHPAIISSRRRR